MTELQSVLRSILKEFVELGVIVLCGFALLKLTSTTTLTGLAFFGVLLLGLFIGLFEASVWESIEEPSLFQASIYLVLLLGGGFLLALNSIVGFLLIIVFCLEARNGYHAHIRFKNGEQLYQKYEWVPNNPIFFPLIPYYYYQYRNSQKM